MQAVDDCEKFSPPMNAVIIRVYINPLFLDFFLFSAAIEPHRKRIANRECYVFDTHRWANMNKTILLVAVAGSKKTTLINALISCIVDEDWKVPFLFQLIPEVDGEEKSKSMKSITTMGSVFTVM